MKRVARDRAVADATKILSHLAGCTEQEAYLYVTAAGELRNGARHGRGDDSSRPLRLKIAVAWHDGPLRLLWFMLDRSGQRHEV